MFHANYPSLQIGYFPVNVIGEPCLDQPFIVSQKLFSAELKNPADPSGIVLFAQLVELAQQFFLLCDVRFTGVSTASSMNISPAPPPRRAGIPLLRKTHLTARLATCWDLHAAASAINRWHFDIATQRRRGHGDRNTAEQVHTSRSNSSCFVHFDKDVEIAGRPAAHSCFAFAGKTNACACFNARRNVHA